MALTDTPPSRALVRAGLISCLLGACTQATPPPTAAATTTTAATPAPTLVGNDRDAHGCIGSAGYTWCAAERACVRPWELASARVFENSAAAFGAHCATDASR